MNKILSTKTVKRILVDAVVTWHKKKSFDFKYRNPLHRLIMEQARHNFTLWHLEDKARVPDVSDKVIADVKRAIDKENQARNDKIEVVDLYIHTLLETKNIKPKRNAVMVSETPGSIIDRAAIITLKIYHMAEELERKDVTEEHILSCKEKISVMMTQRADLLDCLDRLLDDFMNGRKIHKIYRQFKMYNDPALNQAVYKSKKSKGKKKKKK